MPVSFSHIPANIRVPLFYAEVSNELAGHLSMQQPALIIGPVTTDDTDILNQPVLISSTSMAYQQFGAGSVLADMVNTYRQNDTYGELWAIPTSAGVGAVEATGTVTISGQATSGGVLPLYIAGDLYRIGVAAGATALSVATTLAQTINDDAFGLVTAEAEEVSAPPPTEPIASVEGAAARRHRWGRIIQPRDESSGAVGSAVIRVTAKQPGSVGNEISLTVAWRGLASGEQVPPGLVVEVSDMAGGAGVPDLKDALAAMGDDVYDYCCTPWTDAASLDAVEQAMDDSTGRWAWDRQIYGHFFHAKSGTLQELTAFGRSRNDPHVSVLGFAPSPSPSWRRAAAMTAQAATSLRIDPARPLQTLPLVGVLAPDRRTKFTISARNTLLYSGIAVEDEVSGAVRINREATTYQRNAWGQPDPSWLDVTTPATVQYFIRFMRQRILQKFPRHKLADDGTAFGAGQAIVTPRIIKAELVAAYMELVEAGIVENLDSFKELLIVERDASDPNRINVLASPDLVNQLRVVAMLVAFRLRTTGTTAAIAA